MRIFHTQVFNESIEGTGTLYSDPTHNAVMGLVEKLSIFALADTVAVTGTSASVTLNVVVEESADQVHWIAKGTVAEINATCSTVAVTSLVGRDPGTTPSSGFLRLRVALGTAGTNPEAHVRIWVTGRGEQTMQ